MPKMQPEALQQQASDSRRRLFTLLDGVPQAIIEQPGVVDDFSLRDVAAFLAAWAELVNKGLREIQRRKKPTELLRAIEDQTAFWQDAAAANAEEAWHDLLMRFDDASYQLEERLRPLNYDDINRPKRHRWLGNKPLWPLLAQITYHNDDALADVIQQFVARHQGAAREQLQKD